MKADPHIELTETKNVAVHALKVLPPCNLPKHEYDETPEIFEGVGRPSEEVFRPAHPTNGIQHRILIADDDALVRGSLAAVLEFEGYQVDEAGDGNEAVILAVKHPPALVVLDLNMPKWDGWTAFTQLDRLNKGIPVIIITARPNQFDRAERMRVEAFMEKPLNVRVLLDAIQALIGDRKTRGRNGLATREGRTLLLQGARP